MTLEPGRGPANVLVVGSSNWDVIARVARAPQAGETVLCDTYTTARGGKGANQAVAAARSGATVVFIACVGLDPPGQQACEGFRQDGIDVEYVEMLPGVPTGAAFIWVEETGENRIVVASGANSLLSPAHVEKARTAFRHADVLLCQLETPLPTVQRALELAHEAGVRTILNPAPAARLEAEILHLVDILTPNRGEAARLLGLDPEAALAPEELSARLLEAGVRQVIMTLGSEGCLVHSPGQAPCFLPAPAVKVVDTTAAGDTFNGALAALLGAGQAPDLARKTALAAASLACTHPGAQPSIPTLQEVSEFMARTGDIRV